MTLTKEQWKQQWVDDYLDLYNYALALGDKEWQTEIEALLRRQEYAYDDTVREWTKEQLWTQFNTINYKMMELFTLMRKSSSNEEESAIRDLIWQLKLQRMDLAKQIKELC
ncbi:hypothetical protein [Paenibacillus sacheonensis]|uniref:Uncharacterized protein n=1 Tax=Paenibacillus sacheonensis TaxID=742054 RepID=A0A7X4YN86_9BACL|nr:hypothetical protein [Paenibacillus sacheonensis]MBM7565606.1 hypothetical protein [Paenibacillus sacheonensis]NBC69476.1 hypothetical protein [Paenibacillus sacheonensis]